MPLNAIHETVDDIPEQYRDLYTEKNGKYELTGIVGIKTQADIERLQTSLGKERDDHKNTKASLGVWGDLDHEDVMAKLDKYPELEAAAAGKLDDAQIDEVVNRRVEGTLNSRLAPVERDNKRLQAENEELRSQNEGFHQANIKRKIHDDVRKAMVASKVINEAQDDALMLAERIFEVREDDGAVVTKDGVGVTPGIPADQWLVEIQESRPHWWPASVGGGAGGGRSGGGGFPAGTNNPFSAEGWNMTKQGQVVREKGMDYAQRMASAAGTTVGGRKPAPKS